MRRLQTSLLVALLSACGRATIATDGGTTDGDNTDGGSPDADTGSESCFNGEDDDDDGMPDCADPNCAEVATCLPTPGELTAGVLVAADDPCPVGFTAGETVVYRGLDQGQCAGCGCTPGETVCSARFWYYSSAAACTNDTTLTGGIQSVMDIDFPCPSSPTVEGTIYGGRAEIVADPQCSATGAATPEPVAWAESAKFCQASTSSPAGCGVDATCVPKHTEPAGQCALAAGVDSCDGYTSSASDWYTGADDERSCGACTCTTTDGDCNSVVEEVGSDWACTGDVTIAGGSKSCFSSYSPPVRLIGTPTPPTSCQGEAAVVGAAAGTGRSTLCCMP